MQTRAILSKHSVLIDKRPVNIRPLVSFAMFFVSGIFIGARCTNVALLIIIPCITIAAYIFHIRSYKLIAICMYVMAFGILRMALAIVFDNAISVALSNFANIFTPIRNALVDRTTNLFGNNSTILNAILWGDKSGLTQYQRSIFRDTGISHTLALSGLHVSFFIGFFMLIIPKRMRRLRFYFCLCFLMIYCGIAAFPASLVRASIMSILVLTAPLLKERYDSASSISAAALIILLISPLYLFDLGFLLSFTAVIGISLLYKPLCRLFSKAHIIKPLSDTIAVTVSATAGTLPIAAYCLGSFSLYSLIGNIFLLPLVSIMMICALVACLASFISSVISIPFAYIANAACEVITSFASLISTLPLAIISVRITVFICICFYLILFFISDYFLHNATIKLKCITFCSLLALISILVI